MLTSLKFYETMFILYSMIVVNSGHDLVSYGFHKELNFFMQPPFNNILPINILGTAV